MCRSHANTKCKLDCCLESCGHPCWPELDSYKDKLRKHEAQCNVKKKKGDGLKLFLIIKPSKVRYLVSSTWLDFVVFVLVALRSKMIDCGFITEGFMVKCIIHFCPDFLN